MKITKLLTDEAILTEVGRRISSRRVEFNMTQADIAERAGVAKRTVERIEGGASAQISNIIRLFRALDLMMNLDRMIPEPGPKPMDLLKQKGKTRVRASKKKDKRKETGKFWKWKEDE